MRKYRACGCEWNWLIRCLHLPTTPPEWWYRYSKKQRRILLGLIASAAALAVTLTILITVAAAQGAFAGLMQGGADAANDVSPVPEDAMCRLVL